MTPDREDRLTFWLFIGMICALWGGSYLLPPAFVHGAWRDALLLAAALLSFVPFFLARPLARGLIGFGTHVRRTCEKRTK